MLQPELELKITDAPGPAISAAERWSIAIHEAGHAVVCVYYEIPFTRLYIQPNGNGGVMLDREKERLLQSPPRVRYASKLIVSGYAGIVGHRKINPSVPFAGAKYDHDHVSGLLWYDFKYERIFDKTTGSFRSPTEAEVEVIVNRRARRLWRITRRLVHKLYPVIVAVARVLIERKRMTGDEVVAIAGPLIAANATQ
jgi:hypothetical protein